MKKSTKVLTLRLLALEAEFGSEEFADAMRLMNSVRVSWPGIAESRVQLERPRTNDRRSNRGGSPKASASDSQQRLLAEFPDLAMAVDKFVDDMNARLVLPALDDIRQFSIAEFKEPLVGLSRAEASQKLAARIRSLNAELIPSILKRGREYQGRSDSAFAELADHLLMSGAVVPDSGSGQRP